MALDDEIADLRERLRLLEDEREIARLVSRYGPLLDTDSREKAARLWTENGTYANEAASWNGWAEIAEKMVGHPVNQASIRGGASHFLSVPYIVIDGDRAVATNYGVVFRRAGEGFNIFRLVSSRWEFVRTDEGWRIQYRLNQLLDVSALGRQILAAAQDLDHFDPQASQELATPAQS